MRIILDENIPRPLAEWISVHEVTTVQKEGWLGIANGELIRRIDGQFDLFITADKNLRYQQNQNLQERSIAIMELPTNRLSELLAIKQSILDAISRAQPADYIQL